MDQIAAVNMTVQLGRTFVDTMEGHNLLVYIRKQSRGEAKQGKGQREVSIGNHANV